MVYYGRQKCHMKVIFNFQTGARDGNSKRTRCCCVTRGGEVAKKDKNTMVGEKTERERPE